MATCTLSINDTYVMLGVSDIKAYMKIPDSVTAQNDQIETLLAAAKQYIERYTSRLLNDYTVEQYFDDWQPLFRLKYGPCLSVDRFSAWNGTDWIDIDMAHYSVDLIGGRVKMLNLAYTLGDGLNRIKIRYNAGAGKESEPPMVFKTCMYLLVSYWLRSGTEDLTSPVDRVNALLKPHVLNR